MGTKVVKVAMVTEVIKVILAIKVAKLFPIRECSIHP